jgi:hypothetical protein
MLSNDTLVVELGRYKAVEERASCEAVPSAVR